MGIISDQVEGSQARGTYCPLDVSIGDYLEFPFEESNLVNFSLIHILHMWLVLTD